MTRRVTLRIDRITLPTGTRLDQAALSAALSGELRRALATGGPAALGADRSIPQVRTDPVAPPAPNGPRHETALAAAIARSLKP
jgi:hypothetical protein